ncbi:hypothetical protein [Microvirga sp. TS319]|uniref:hypothetical protein n=1 Tax=Microvirga sp. TS319 TaxID=3241165 RepID=UPI003519DC6A
MQWQRNRRSEARLVVAVLGSIIGTALAGCSTSADVSYGSYQFGPGYQSGRVYESRVYGDTQQGFGAENCRTVMHRQADAFGRLSSAEETVCD